MFKRTAACSVLAFLAGSFSSASAADMDYERMMGLVVSGQVESWSGYMIYGNESGDFDPSEDTSQFMSGLDARLSLPLGTNLSAQVDAELEYSSTALLDEKQDDLFNNSMLLGTHLSWRDPQSFLIGGFVAAGLGNHDDDGTPAAGFYAVGGEFQFYVDDLTFYGQGGALNGAASNDDDYLSDAFFGRGVVRWFMTPNSRLQGEFSYVNGETDNDNGVSYDTTILEWGVRYDTMIPGLPLLGDSNVFVGYRGADFDKSGDTGGFTDHTIMVGFSRSFGGSSMREFDRVGATLDLPNFGRWVSSGEALE